MPANFAELCRRVGVPLAKPLAETSRKRLFSKLDCKVPNEVSAFYQVCDGIGPKPHRIRRSKRQQSPSQPGRFYPLAEAVEMAGQWDFLVSFRLLPLFEFENNISDPCMVGIDGPLAGYVFQICHDTPTRVHAPSIAGFLKDLAAKTPEQLQWMEQTSFTYPKKLTAAEKKTVQKLIDRSMTALDAAPSVLIALAMSMLTDDEFVSLMGGVKHPNKHAQLEIIHRLKRLNSVEAKRALQSLEISQKDLKAFVKEAVRRLKKAGLPANTNAAGTTIQLDIGPNYSYDGEELYRRKDSPGFWDRLIEDAQSNLATVDDEGDEDKPESPEQLPTPLRPTLKLYQEVTSKVTWWGCEFCGEEELTDHPKLGSSDTARTTPKKKKEWNIEMGRLAMQQGWRVVPADPPVEYLVMCPICAAEHYGE
jgi:hypothetical protein